MPSYVIAAVSTDSLLFGGHSRRSRRWFIGVKRHLLRVHPDLWPQILEHLVVAPETVPPASELLFPDSHPVVQAALRTPPRRQTGIVPRGTAWQADHQAIRDTWNSKVWFGSSAPAPATEEDCEAWAPRGVYLRRGA